MQISPIQLIHLLATHSVFCNKKFVLYCFYAMQILNPVGKNTCRSSQYYILICLRFYMKVVFSHIFYTSNKITLLNAVLCSNYFQNHTAAQEVPTTRGIASNIITPTCACPGILFPFLISLQTHQLTHQLTNKPFSGRLKGAPLVSVGH